VVTSEDGATTIPWIVVVTVASNTGTEILTYSLPEQTGPAIINDVQHTIDVEVEYGTDLTNLIATFTLSLQARAFIGPVRQESGVTSNDFSSTVTYNVRAGDNLTTQDWDVNVYYTEPESETDILNFSFEQQVGDTRKDTVNNMLYLFVVEGTEIDRLIASFELSKGATAYIDTVLQISGETVNDFSDTVEYTIVAQDGVTMQNWKVKVEYEFEFEYLSTPNEFPVSNQTIQASARLPIDFEVDRVVFYYRKFENQGWEQTEITGSQGVYTIDITRSMVGNLGMFYYFDAIDTTGSNRPLRQIQLILHYDTDYPQIPNLRFGGTVNQYQIISVPFNLQNTNAEAVFDELGAYNIKHWRMFRHDGISTREYRDGFTNIDPGLGYWLIVREQATITTGEGRTLRLDSITHGFEIDLEPGWNQVGNPFDIDISWDDVIFDNNNLNIGRVKLFSSDSLVEGYVIPRYRGGFVFLEGVQPVTANLRPVSIANARRQPYVNTARFNALDQSSWIAGLKISNGTVTNTLSGIGMHPEAVVGKDRQDEVLMPVPKEIIPFELSFNHPDEQYQKFSKDIIQSTDQYIWEFDVKSFSSSQTLTISWDNRYFGDNDYHLILNHKGPEILVDMKEMNSYSFDAAGVDQFRILFGDNAFISNELKPNSIIFGNSYPNPFRDQLIIPFTLPESNSEYNVNISIYDMTGNLVKQLTNEYYSSGYYAVSWNSLEDDRTLHSGLYIIKMMVRSDKINTILTGKVMRY
jgi:hypothetical protein